MPRLTFLGHSAFLIEGGGSRILVDPFLTGNPKASTSPGDVECDYIILTHAHGDHVGDTADIARRTGAPIISNYEIVTYFEGKGLSGHPMNTGGSWTFPFGRVKFTIAHHSSTFPDGTNGGNPSGIILWLDGKAIHHAGDTALTHNMSFVGEEGIDLAMLPIGDNFTMGISDAVRALDFIKPKKVIPIHFDTFPFVEVDVQDFRNRSEAKGVECVVLEPGQTHEV